MISSSDILLKAVVERELLHINLMIDNVIRSEYPKETLVLVSEYLEERIKSFN